MPHCYHTHAIHDIDLPNKLIIEKAGRLGVTQPRLNELLTGKLSRFSLDALVDLAGAAGIELDITPRATGKTVSKPRRTIRKPTATELAHA